MHICPICNGLYNCDFYCSKCGSKMEILDRVENYDDSYAPYLSYSITDLNDGDPPNICSHTLVCSNCKNEEKIKIRNLDK